MERIVAKLSGGGHKDVVAVTDREREREREEEEEKEGGRQRGQMIADLMSEKHQQRGQGDRRCVGDER